MSEQTIEDPKVSNLTTAEPEEQWDFRLHGDRGAWQAKQRLKAAGDPSLAKAQEVVKKHLERAQQAESRVAAIVAEQLKIRSLESDLAYQKNLLHQAVSIHRDFENYWEQRKGLEDNLLTQGVMRPLMEHLTEAASVRIGSRKASHADPRSSPGSKPRSPRHDARFQVVNDLGIAAVPEHRCPYPEQRWQRRLIESNSYSPSPRLRCLGFLASKGL